MTTVLGVDGCRAGWCAAEAEARDGVTTVTELILFRSFAEVLDHPASVVCIDVPMGLLDVPGARGCDVEARRLLRPLRASSVFPAPSRMALAFSDYVAASEANFAATGRRLSRQSFGIARKVAEVDALMKPPLQDRVLEVHPEVCFRSMDRGRPMSHRKSTAEGLRERWSLLREVFPRLPPDPVRPPRGAGWKADDYVDALAAALTAVSFVRGEARCVPEEPLTDARGLRMEIWHPA